MQRLRNAGLWARIVVGVHPRKDGTLEVVVRRGAAPENVSAIQAALTPTPFRLVEQPWGVEPLADAKDLLRAAGLISAPVIGLQAANRGVVTVTVMTAASEEQVRHVHDVLGSIKHEIQRGHTGRIATYEP